MSLRRYADASSQSLATIPRGAKLKLISWYGKFARVEYNGIKGYVLANYIAPDNGYFINTVLDTVSVTATYTYEQMLDDLIEFDQRYPDLVDLEIIGYTTMGEQIPVIRVGNENAKYHILFQASIHGREHATTWVLMALLDYWLDRGIDAYTDTCFHIIPMVNPDGVRISQTATLPDSLLAVYQNDLKNGYTSLSKEAYAKNWKANGRGVDLNRNFDAGWSSITNRTSPSSELYRGTSVFSEPETQALREYTQRYTFNTTISYHAMGSAVYYDYGNNTAVNNKGLSLGREVCSVTGYHLIDSVGIDSAGYKDWVIQELKIPSLTVEIGSQSAPLAERELYSTLIRNLKVFDTVVQWLRK